MAISRLDFEPSLIADFGDELDETMYVGEIGCQQIAAYEVHPGAWWDPQRARDLLVDAPGTDPDEGAVEVKDDDGDGRRHSVSVRA